MNTFAHLLDRLAYEPGRNNKLRLIADYLRATPDPERGLRARRAHRRADLPARQGRHDPRADRRAHRSGAVRTVLRLRRRPVGNDRTDVAGRSRKPRQRDSGAVGCRRTPVDARQVATAGQLARWLDALDDTGRWALIKLVTGALRIGVSARLAKTAVAALGGRTRTRSKILWPGLRPPYEDLFAWLDGRADKPENRDPAPFRPVMLAHAIEDKDLAARSPRQNSSAEWKWDGIRVQAVGTSGGQIAAALLAHRRGHRRRFPDVLDALQADGVDRRRTADHPRRRSADLQRSCSNA